MARNDSSGFGALALSGVVIAVLWVSPYLFQWFGVIGVLILLALTLAGVGLLFAPPESQRPASTPPVVTRPEAGRQRHRKRRGKGAAHHDAGEDARGLVFYGLKTKSCGGEGSVDAQTPEQLTSSLLQRTISKDTEGNLWEFKESLCTKSVSLGPGSSLRAGKIPSSEPEKPPPPPTHTLPRGVSDSTTLDAQLEQELTAIFKAASLLDHMPAARRWCSDQGAGFITEVLENVDDLVKTLALDKKSQAALEQSCKARSEQAPLGKTASSISRSPSQMLSQARSLTKTMSVGLSNAASFIPGYSQLPLGTLKSQGSTTSLGVSSTGLGAKRTTSTSSVISKSRSISYYQNVPVRTATVTVDATEHILEDDGEDDTDSEDEEEPKASTEPFHAKHKFQSAAKAVLFGVRMGLIGKRKREEFEASQIALEEVEPAEEEKVDGKSALSKIASFAATPGVSCVTLLIPAGTPTFQFIEKQADGKRGRKYLKLIAAHLPGGGDDIPKNGLGLFLKVFGGGGDQDELVAIEPPKPIRKFALSDGPVFAAELLVQLFVEDDSAGCLVISGHEALVYRIFQDHAVIETKVQPRLQKRQKKGGQSALRISRLAEEVRDAYVRIVAEKANAEFVDLAEGNATVDLLSVGGSKELADNLHKSAHLHYRLKQIVKRAPDISENDHMPQVVRKTQALRHQVAASSASATLKDLEAQAHTSLASYGLKEVAKRIEEYNLSVLLFATGCGLSSKIIQQAQAIDGARIEEVGKGLPAHEELTRKWGGAIAKLRWEPQDYEEN